MIISQNYRGEKIEELGVIKRFKVVGLMENQEKVSKIQENMESDHDFEKDLRTVNKVFGTDGNFNENADDNSNTEERRFYGEIEEEIDIVERNFYKFNNFQVINDIDEFNNLNKYKDYTVNIRNPNMIFQEWNALETSLPKSIFVRVYKSRIDIAQAIIVGPEGTPYNNTLFLFDILFPIDYPNHPPHVFYHSYGLELLPYLHCDGYVSHSLLNEDWNPKKSNLLEVLVTIQNQLLIYDHNDYSDKGYDHLMQICMTMIDLLNRPPKSFEIYVKGFYRTRAHYILLHCKARLAEFVGDDNKDMKKVFFKLVRKFEKNGTYCKHHYKEEELKEAFKDDDQLNHKMFWNLSDFASKLVENFKFCMELLMEDVGHDHL